MGHHLITYTHNIQRHAHAHSCPNCSRCHLHLEHFSSPSRILVTHTQSLGVTEGNWESFFCSAQTPASLTASCIGSPNLFWTFACLGRFLSTSNPNAGVSHRSHLSIRSIPPSTTLGKAHPEVIRPALRLTLRLLLPQIPSCAHREFPLLQNSFKAHVINY